MNEHEDYEWIHSVKQTGLGDFLYMAVKVLAPLGPIGAQLLFVAEPLAGLAFDRKIIRDIANALEEPEHIKHLQEQLERQNLERQNLERKD